MGTPDSTPIPKMLGPAAIEKIADRLRAGGSESHLTALESRVLINCYASWQERVKRLLQIAGSAGTCTSCGRVIVWVKMASSGKLNPISPNGVSHFADCPSASQHRKTKPARKPARNPKPPKPKQEPIDFKSQAANDE